MNDGDEVRAALKKQTCYVCEKGYRPADAPGHTEKHGAYFCSVKCASTRAMRDTTEWHRRFDRAWHGYK